MQQFQDYPFQSKFLEVHGSRMHYIESGGGDPVLFIHGQPTWSYLWRNIIPKVAEQNRAIAVDLIGMGLSDKPDLEYRYPDHIRYLESFIDSLQLNRLTLVMHDWGSVLGFDYAMRHEESVEGLIFMEALIPPAFPLPSLDALPEAAREAFAGFRDPKLGRELLINQNVFIEQMLPNMVLRDLSDSEMDAHRFPFLDPATREPVYRWPNELPIAGEPEHTHELIQAIGEWLTQTPIPKLHLYAKPGAANPPEIADWTAVNFNNIETQFVGAGLHFMQEDQPEAISISILEWLVRIREIRRLESDSVELGTGGIQ